MEARSGRDVVCAGTRGAPLSFSLGRSPEAEARIMYMARTVVCTAVDAANREEARGVRREAYGRAWPMNDMMDGAREDGSREGSSFQCQSQYSLQ